MQCKGGAERRGAPRPEEATSWALCTGPGPIHGMDQPMIPQSHSLLKNLPTSRSLCLRDGGKPRIAHAQADDPKAQWRAGSHNERSATVPGSTNEATSCSSLQALMPRSQQKCIGRGGSRPPCDGLDPMTWLFRRRPSLGDRAFRESSNSCGLRPVKVLRHRLHHAALLHPRLSSRLIKGNNGW